MKLIGLGGLKGCGKSTIARHVGLVAARHAQSHVTYSFASPMKAMVDALMRDVGLDETQRLNYLDNKEVGIVALQGFSMRTILQTLGTEWARDCLDDDFWSEIGRMRIRQAARHRTALIMFDDVRFENEAEMIREEGGKVIQLQRYNVEAGDGHVSEAMSYEPDLVVHNNDEPMRVAEYIWHELTK